MINLFYLCISQNMPRKDRKKPSKFSDVPDHIAQISYKSLEKWPLVILIIKNYGPEWSKTSLLYDFVLFTWPGLLPVSSEYINVTIADWPLCLLDTAPSILQQNLLLSRNSTDKKHGGCPEDCTSIFHYYLYFL